MKTLFKISAIAALAIAATGCTRIETGSIGVRLNASKQIEGTELLPGSWNQTLIGSVLEFPVKDIVVALENRNPMTADNSALADFDITVVYSINPSSVAELYSTKSRSFHAEGRDGTLLMYNYMTTLVNNASYKAIRQYKALEVADNRAKLEAEILAAVQEQLKSEKLDTALNLSVVQVRNVAPNADILKAATEYVRAQNELKIKETEVAIAKKESERMAALAQNSQQSIAYMQAQANLMIAEGIKNGKVQTIIVPHNMTALGNISK